MREEQTNVDTQESIEHIARYIKKTVTDNFVLDTDTLHFLQSSYSIDTHDDFLMLLEYGAVDDLETILDLVLAPDHRIMCGIEPFLADLDFSADDERLLLQKISEASLDTRLSFPDDFQPIELAIPTEVIERFIRKLNLTCSFPRRVTQAMEDHLHDTLIIPARVLFRHSKWVWSDELIEFACQFFQYMSRDSDHLMDDLSWVVGELSGSITGKSIRDRLIHSLEDYRKRLGEIETLADMLKKSTMETLMLQGVRVPSISAETLRQRITTARRVLATVYAWVDGPGMTPYDIHLGDFSGPDGMKKMVNLLT